MTQQVATILMAATIPNISLVNCTSDLHLKVSVEPELGFLSLLSQTYLTLLDDEDHTLESLKIQDEQQLVIEGIQHESLLSVPGFLETRSCVN